MKIILGIVLSSFFMISCSESKKKIEKNEALVGADRDENNCIGSAGYTWSELKQECIQVFEVGKRFSNRKVVYN